MSKVMLSIEEPNSCDECPFSELETYGYYCQLLNKYINSLKRKEHSTIPKLCPLRELPDYRTETYKWEDRLLSLQDVIESMAYEIATYRHSNRYSHIEDVDDILREYEVDKIIKEMRKYGTNISPWLIYFASRADAVGTLFLIVAVAAFAICLIGFDDLTKNGFKLFISIGIISVILTVLTPTTETVYTMMVANELTSDNVQAIGKTGKDVIDYITDQIDKVVNDKEEDKK